MGSGTAKYPLLLTAFERQRGRFSYVRAPVLLMRVSAHGVLNVWPHLYAYELKTAHVMRRYTRLSNGFSHKIQNHAAAVALYYFSYNFIKIHRTLRVSPAMAAGAESQKSQRAMLLPKPTRPLVPTQTIPRLCHRRSEVSTATPTSTTTRSALPTLLTLRCKAKYVEEVRNRRRNGRLGVHDLVRSVRKRGFHHNLLVRNCIDTASERSNRCGYQDRSQWKSDHRQQHQRVHRHTRHHCSNRRRHSPKQYDFHLHGPAWHLRPSTWTRKAGSTAGMVSGVLRKSN